MTNTHGGPRPGAGRKPKARRNERLPTISPALFDRLMAAHNGNGPLSNFVEALLGHALSDITNIIPIYKENEQ